MTKLEAKTHLADNVHTRADRKAARDLLDRLARGLRSRGRCKPAPIEEDMDEDIKIVIKPVPTKVIEVEL